MATIKAPTSVHDTFESSRAHTKIILPLNRDTGRDPEGVTLGENLEILASLVSVMDRMENPTSGRSVKAGATAGAKVHRLSWVFIFV